MNLKALPNRTYNILFHTHTVTGIVICCALYIIFYAGAFALFKDEIYQWENHEARVVPNANVDYDQLVAKFLETHPNAKIDDHLTIVFPSKNIPVIRLYAEIENDDATHTRIIQAINPNTLAIPDDTSLKTTVGETIFRLHYFDQIPTFGLYLAGFVSLFFLFATVTGILIHWKNVLQKFYAYTTDGKWKTIWTNAHTVLGIITVPFQVVFAVTGALFGLLFFLLAPSTVVLFDGDSAPIFEIFSPQEGIPLDENAPYNPNLKGINFLYQKAQEHFPEQEVVMANFHHFGKDDANVSFYVDDGSGILGDGVVVYAMKTGEYLAEITPNHKNYSQAVYNLLIKLHFGTFGGIVLKIVYFLLALITCYVLISGILIWKVARENKNYTQKQQRFYHRVTKAYLAICLSLFPATALLFAANKLVPMEMGARVGAVNSIFFIGWLLMAVAGLFFNKYRKLNNFYVILGGILSLSVPIANGIVTGDWLWASLQKGLVQVFCVDLFWLLTGLIALFVYWKFGKNKSR